MRTRLFAIAFAVSLSLGCTSDAQSARARTSPTPLPSPFGTAGLTGIPPRPSHPPSGFPSRRTPTPRPEVAAAEFASAVESVRIAIPGGAEELPRESVPARGNTCGEVTRTFVTSQPEALHTELVRAVVNAQFLLQYRDTNVRRAELWLVLEARSGRTDLEVFSGSRPGAMFPALDRYLMRVIFRHRCLR